MTPEARLARIERILADKAAGIRRRETARALGITPHRLGEWIAEHMRHFPGFGPQRLSDEERQRRRQAYVDGIALGEDVHAIAARCGCTGQQMYSWLRDSYAFDLGRPKYKHGAAKRKEPEPIDRTPLHLPRTERKCMTCTRPFLSEGAHNRMCGRCRIAASDHGSPYEPNPGGHQGRRVGVSRP